MVYSFSFHVPGKPRGAARPRFTRQGHAYTLREDQIYRALVTAKAREAIRSIRYSGESAQNFRVDIGVFFKIPSSWAKAKKAAALKSYLGERAYSRLCETAGLILFTWESHRGGRLTMKKWEVQA